MNGRTRNPDVGGYARQKYGRQRQAPVPRLLPWDGGFPTSGSARTAKTVDSASLLCCPSHCFGSLHHVSLLRSDFIKRDDARDLQKMTSEEEKNKKQKKKSRLQTWRRETPWKPALTPSLQPLHPFYTISTSNPARLLGEGCCVHGTARLRDYKIKQQRRGSSFSDSVFSDIFHSIFVFCRNESQQFAEYIRLRFSLNRFVMGQCGDYGLILQVMLGVGNYRHH